MAFKLTVNGQARTVDVPADMPLLWVLHAVQLAWQEIDVPQCGYCQAGQIMTAAALLAKNSKPTDQQIDEAMGGNICRCGTYLRIRQAIHRAAAIHANRAELERHTEPQLVNAVNGREA